MFLQKQPLNLLFSIFRIGFLVFAIIGIASGCTTVAMKSPPSLDQLAVQHRVCAVVIAVIKERKVDSLSSSTACEKTVPLNSDSIFQAASLSKTVFAYAVTKLVEQGKLDLDKPVITYLPHGYWRQSSPFGPEDPAKRQLVTDPRLERLTARMILNHTSGLPNWANRTLHFDFEPGEKWQYSGEGYLLLQRVVETITNQSLGQFMNDQVFKPMGMRHSDYTWQSRFESNFIPSTTSDGTPTQSMLFSSPVAAATLYTSAQDFAQFLVTLLNDSEALKEITDSPVMVEPSLNLSWGLGWGIESRGQEHFIWQWGNNPGYRAFAIASLRTGDGFVLLTNSDHGLALAEPMADKILPGPHAVFRFYMLRSGVAHVLCKEFDICI